MICIIAIIIAINTRATNYYCCVKSTQSNNCVWINGFPVGDLENHINGSQIMTTCITNFLIDGNNKIDVMYSPDNDSDENSSLRWEISTSPDTQKSFTLFSQPIVSGIMKSRVLSWNNISRNDIIPSQGMINDHQDLVFNAHGTHICWGGRLRSEIAFSRIPSKFEFYNTSELLTDVHIVFMKSGTPIRITFHPLTIPIKESKQCINLTSNLISDGAQWMTESGFDEIWIYGKLTKPSTADITLNKICFSEIMGSLITSKSFNIKLPYHWPWQDAQIYSSLSDTDKEGIWQVLQTYYNALESKDIAKLDELLKEQNVVALQLMKCNQKDLDSMKHETYNTIFTDLGANPPSLIKQNMRYIIINPQVITIKTFDGNDPISGESALHDGSFYNCPMYYSHINGKWVIIW